LASTLIRCEHFIYGQIDGVGYRLIKSKGVDDILTQDEIHQLCLLDSVEPVFTLTGQRKYVAVTYFGYTIDEYHRRNHWQHTILMFIGDFFKLCPITPFTPHFIHESNNPPAKLLPLLIEE